MNMEEFYAKLAEEERQAELEREAARKRWYEEHAEEIAKREAEEAVAEAALLDRMAGCGVDIEDFKSEIRSGTDEFEAAVLCGYDFTDKIEVLADPDTYEQVMEVLQYSQDAFSRPEYHARLKKQCAELFPYMQEKLEAHIEDLWNHDPYAGEYLDGYSDEKREYYADYERYLTTNESDTKTETRDVAEEKADKTVTLQEANIAKTDESDASNRLAAVRKALAKHVDDALGTHLEERKIPEKAKKIERKVSNVIFKSRGGNGD